jgi:sulfate transport system ATP-binding protein
MSIVLTGLCKNYQGLPVVNHINLEIRDGELFVLLGGSGSGKSTILRMIAGLTDPDEGRIELKGRDVTHLAPQVRDTGFVFQNYSIFRHMTVAQNIEFGLRIRNIPAPQRRQRCEELMDLVELAGLGERDPSQLSGGQLQRVALARALAYEPAVLLLDEPFGALDVKIRGQLRRSLKEIQRRLGVTSILVTHDQEEGFELGDRIGVLDRGSLLEVGTPDELYHRPSSQFVATFIGGGNVLVGQLCPEGVKLGQRVVPCPPELALPGHLEGARVRLLARAENVEVRPEASLLEGHSLGLGSVAEAVFTGSGQRLRLNLPELDGVRCIAPTPVYGQEHPQLEAWVASRSETFKVGQTVAVGLLHYHLLERTGLRSLILVDFVQESRVALDFGLRVAEATGAPATLLAIAGVNEREADVATRLVELHGQLLDRNPNLKMCVRRGGLSEEVLREVREGRHELVVIGEDEGPSVTRMGPWAQRLLARSEVPVLLVQQDRPRIERILICSAGGEPGKGDVWMGGRVAKRAGASVSVCHAVSELAEPERKARVRTHLHRAVSSLHAMGVKARPRLLDMGSNATVAQILLHEMEEGNYDLIVMGMPSKTALATRLVRSNSRPFLFVPMA